MRVTISDPSCYTILNPCTYIIPLRYANPNPVRKKRSDLLPRTIDISLSLSYKTIKQEYCTFCYLSWLSQFLLLSA
jgi:hypothetical protein